MDESSQEDTGVHTKLAAQSRFSGDFLFSDPANHLSASQTLATLTTFNGAAELQGCDAATKYAGGKSICVKIRVKQRAGSLDMRGQRVGSARGPPRLVVAS